MCLILATISGSWKNSYHSYFRGKTQTTKHVIDKAIGCIPRTHAGLAALTKIITSTKPFTSYAKRIAAEQAVHIASALVSG
jgi:hypothetical protein